MVLATKRLSTTGLTILPLSRTTLATTAVTILVVKLTECTLTFKLDQTTVSPCLRAVEEVVHLYHPRRLIQQAVLPAHHLDLQPMIRRLERRDVLPFRHSVILDPWSMVAVVSMAVSSPILLPTLLGFVMMDPLDHTIVTLSLIHI